MKTMTVLLTAILFSSFAGAGGSVGVGGGTLAMQTALRSLPEVYPGVPAEEQKRNPNWACYTMFPNILYALKYCRTPGSYVLGVPGWNKSYSCQCPMKNAGDGGN